jgi:RHS repeat-associated protein
MQTVDHTTPAGRSVQAKLNSLGYPSEVSVSGSPFSPLLLSYDTRGRLIQADQGTRRVKLAWDAATGLLDSLWAGTTSDAQLHFVNLTIDARGQLGTITHNDTRQIKLAYDVSSNLTLLQRPADPSGFVDHAFTPNDVDLLATYTAPSNPATQYAWDLDRRLDAVTWPNGTGVDLVYVPAGNAHAGKLHQLKTLTGQVLSTYGYNSTSGRLTSVDTSGGVSTSLGWDGPALLSAATTWPDAVSKTASWTLGNYLLVSAEAVTGGNSITYAYDADQLATSATVAALTHTMSAARHPNTGWVSSTSLKKISQTLAYDPVYGQLSSVNTKFNSADNVHTLTLQTYDGLGRLTTRKEKILAEAETTRTYAYDSTGRLSGDGTTTWAYDANGNRTKINGVTVATYDPQDRILTHQSASFTHDTNGQRITKTQSGHTTTYGYDVFGNLQTVSLPGGVVVTYELDGAGRRVGRSKSGATYRRYLLGEGNRVVAEYDQAGTIVSQFVYLTRSHVPDFMIQGSNVYRFITDQLGSVRLVVNVNASTASGSVVQRLDYDAWGNVTNVPSAFDQPFGFAGGLWDRDTGLVHFGAREYDPATGRWLQKEPLGFGGGDTNLYAYGYGDPVNWIDPSGRIPAQGWNDGWFGLDWNTAVGIWIGLAGVAAGGDLPTVAWQGGGPVFEFGHNPFQATAGYSTTWGHAICYSGDPSFARDHEYAHIEQHQALGTNYLPAHAIAQFVSLAVAGDYASANPLEVGPYSSPPRPWPWPFGWP